ncbi:MAG: hypothetical protein ABI548_19440 [Polyangiaceae bacterium]
MHFGNMWLLAFVCLVLGGCTVAAMPAPQALLPKSQVQVQVQPAAAGGDDASRLGPPSPRGLGQRRVDRAVSTSAALARE